MSAFKPMLASDFGDIGNVKFPCLASPKIDGIRCVIKDGKALSRSLKPIPNPLLRALLEQPELEGLDGELVCGNFQKTTSLVMGRSVSAEDTAKIIFWVFDRHDISKPFGERLAIAHRYVAVAGLPYVQSVIHTVIPSAEALDQYEALTLAAGFEGVMLRDLLGPYKHGRSTAREGYLLKVKRFADAEAEIVGFEERMHNGNEATTNELGRTKRSSAQAGKTGRGDLGAFVLASDKFKCSNCAGKGVITANDIGFGGQAFCDDCDGDGCERFTCGSGLNDAQRAEFWHNKNGMIGKLVKFKYQEHGTKDAPRSPVFIGVRAEEDL